MPFMAQFHTAYLNAYFVGMGFSSLIPSLLTLIQGVGKYECEGAIPHFFPPRFSASSFFFVIFCWTITAMVSFEILSRRDEYTTIAPRISAGKAHEATPLNGTTSKSTES
ncbi:hypothetical protein GCK32_012600, partial [Trichostrongylus colubriformis]